MDNRTILTESILVGLNLEPQELGYYYISDDMIISIDLQVYINNEYATRSIWIAELKYLEELTMLIEVANR